MAEAEIREVKACTGREMERGPTRWPSASGEGGRGKPGSQQSNPTVGQRRGLRKGGKAQKLRKLLELLERRDATAAARTAQGRGAGEAETATLREETWSFSYTVFATMHVCVSAAHTHTHTHTHKDTHKASEGREKERKCWRGTTARDTTDPPQNAAGGRATAATPSHSTAAHSTAQHAPRHAQPGAHAHPTRSTQL